MFKRAIAFTGLVLSISAAACSSAPEGDDGTSSEDALTSASEASKVKGAWTLQNDVTSVQAFVLNGDHTFFRANTRILNGLVVNGGGATLERETGTWSLSAAKGTITFTTDKFEETFTYSFTPAPVLNGIFLPGHEPKDKLELRGIAAKGSKIAFPTQDYARADSYCLETNDCNAELANKIWTPVEAEDIAKAHVSCNEKTNACDMTVTEQ